MENWRKAMTSVFKKMDRQKWIVCILLGVLLLVIAIPVDTKEKRLSGAEQKQEPQLENETYVRQLEQELEELIAQMHGVGAVRVMITLEDEGESVLAQDSNSKSSVTKEAGEVTQQEMSAEHSTVLASNTPYETKTISPKIRGVCVVAQGASDDHVRVAIYEAIQALFSVDAHKISIVEMGSQEGA